MKLKIAMALCAAAMCATAELARSEWHNMVSDCAQNPETLKATIAQLSPADQCAFLGEVNEAISKLPGSDESRAAAFYNANRAAVTGVAAENRTAILAEVFATVPVEYLTDINERFANELFSRTANPARTISDAEFTSIATGAMAVINERCSNAENGGVRSTFAALMFLRASGGSPGDLSSTLVSQMPDAATREAAPGWIKEAMGDGQEQSYDSMLGAAKAGEEPDHAVVLQIASPFETAEAMLADLGSPSKSVQAAGSFVSPGIVGGVPNDDAPDSRLNRIPRGYIASKDAVGGNSEGRYKDSDEENPYYGKNRGNNKSGGGGYNGGGYNGQVP